MTFRKTGSGTSCQKNEQQQIKWPTRLIRITGSEVYLGGTGRMR